MDFEELVSNNISRAVAFVLTPILVPTVTAIAAWAQDAIGINLDGGALTAYVVTVAVGISAAAVTWLFNRGGWEVAQAELIKLHELGQAELERADPAQPPGTLPN